MCLYQKTEEPSSLKLLQPKFLIRKDLDQTARVKIAVIAKFFKRHGTITNLSKRHSISRTMIYNLVGQLSLLVDDWFSQDQVPSEYLRQIETEDNISRLLRYRLVGTCSISKCSTLLKADEVKNSSFGWCQSQLQYTGSLLPNMVTWQGPVVFASDEIYYTKNGPILVTVDPISGVILRIDKEPVLNQVAWEKHWSSLLVQGIQPLLLIRDEGKSMIAAQKKVLEQVDFQPDTFHAVTHKLYKIEQTLLRKAHQAIAIEYKAEGVAFRAVSLENQANKLEKKSAAQQKTLQALELLEHFQWLYHYLRKQLRVVRTDGTLRLRTFAEQEVQAALDLMKELPYDMSKVIEQIESLLPQLFNFLTKAVDTVEQIRRFIPAHLVPFWMAYWQYQRSLINIKATASRKRLIQRFDYLEPLLKEQYEDQDFKATKATVFAHLNTIIQSSSMVESINALIRPFINETKRQISQEMLNLVMFFHNHRRFKRGKRKGFAPIELLTGKTLELSWEKLLLQIIRKGR